MKYSRAMMLLVLGLRAISVSGQPSFTFTILKVPFPGGATSTDAAGISDSGTIVGSYFDGSVTHGFILKQDKYTAFDVPVPGVVTTAPNGINDGGDIVGFYQTIPVPPRASNHGFILQGSVLTTLDPPGATGSFALGINNLGEIVGRFVDVLGTSHGFLRERDAFITIDVPGALSTAASGINDLGVIVGSYTGSDGRSHGFVKNGSAFTSFDVPFPHSDMSVNGINDLDQIVGNYFDSLIGSSHGFIFANGEFTSFDFPSLPLDKVHFTDLLGINDLGEIVGGAGFKLEPGQQAQLFSFLGQP
jgi:uncharacterized membrane protein